MQSNLTRISLAHLCRRDRIRLPNCTAGPWLFSNQLESPPTLSESEKYAPSYFFLWLRIMSIIRGVISLTIAFHCPENVSTLSSITHQPSTSGNTTHLRSRTASPAFFKDGPLVFHRSSHVSNDIFVSEPRPIALRKLSGVEISPVRKGSVSGKCLMSKTQHASTSWQRHGFKECAVLKCAARWQER